MMAAVNTAVLATRLPNGCELIADGEVDSKEVRSQSQAAGLTWATVRRAKTWLGIKPQRRSDGSAGEGKWVWRLPPERLQGAQKSHPTDDLAKQAGHSNKRTTARVYDRERLEAARRVAKARTAHRGNTE